MQKHACRLGYEGIASKRLGSRYESERWADWVKCKNPAQRQCGGYKRKVDSLRQ